MTCMEAGKMGSTSNNVKAMKMTYQKQCATDVETYNNYYQSSPVTVFF